MLRKYIKDVDTECRAADELTKYIVDLLLNVYKVSENEELLYTNIYEALVGLKDTRESNRAIGGS